MPARSASAFSASMKGMLSRFITKLSTSPPVAHAPKQRQPCRSGNTKNDGVRSW